MNGHDEAMPADKEPFDRRVGRLIRVFRGEMSQIDLAARMRDKGFKWSQGTVWAVEKGDRPVRLSEVTALSEILDYPVQAFLLTVDDAETLQKSSENVRHHLREARYHVDVALEAWSKAKDDVLIPYGIPMSGDLPKRADERLRVMLQRLEEFVQVAVGPD